MVKTREFRLKEKTEISRNAAQELIAAFIALFIGVSLTFLTMRILGLL